MLNRFIQFFCGLSLLVFCQIPARAQEFFPTQRKIEKTRIQFQKQTWKYISSDFFEIYFFGKNENLAKNTLQLVESESQHMTELLGYSPYRKVKIFLYPSQDDLFQSNTGISFENQVELKTNNLENFRIELAFQNDFKQFKEELLKSLATVYVHDMLYSGSVKDVLQNSLFLNVSEWYLKGLSAYIALGETGAMNQFMFQAIRNNKIRKINIATGLEAELLGQSIWSYIVKMYGRQPLSNIVNLTRIIRNEQSSIASTLKKPFGKFLQDWYKYYYNQNAFITNNVSPLNAIDQIIQVDLSKGEKIGTYLVSPDGQWLVYSIQNATKFETYLYQFSTKKKTAVLKHTINDPLGLPDVVGPKYTWGKGNSLYVLYAEEGKTWLTSFAALNNGKPNLKISNRREIKDLNCLSAEISPNNQKLLLKVLRNGQVDVGTYDLRRNRFSPITQDKSDESEAHWSTNGNDVLYVSTAIVDTTIAEKDKKGFSALYTWNPDSTFSKEIFRIRGEIKDFNVKDDSLIQFLGSSRNGKVLLTYSLKEQKIKEKLVDVGSWTDVQLNQQHIIVKKNDMLNQSLALVAQDEISKGNLIEFTPELETNFESLTNESSTDSLTNELINRRNAQRKARLERNVSLKTKSLSSTSKGVLAYENSFAGTSMNGYFKSDPIRGIGYALQANMNDLMENHLIHAGIFLAANLKNSDLWGEYNYLANRTDYSIRFDRKVLNQDLDYDYSQRIRFNRIEVKALYPFNLRHKLAISGTYSLSRAIDQINFRTPESVMGFAGIKSEYQFDNTLHVEENLQEGQRVWASAEFQKSTIQSGGYVKLKLDARKYISITNWLYFFGRFSASHNVKVGALEVLPQTILGGMDNWLFQTRESRTTENPLGTNGIAQRDVFMSDFAGNLRGFGVNKMSGNSHLLLNLELHISVKKLVSQDQERSQFLNNLQLVGFTDIGSAWTGSSPFSKYNGFNTNEYGGKTNPFIATVTDFRNPFLFGFGLGARSKILGYYIKLDYAVGMSDGAIMPSMTYLSLGHDF